jgi:hypothetical protein
VIDVNVWDNLSNFFANGRDMSVAGISWDSSALPVGLGTSLLSTSELPKGAGTCETSTASLSGE